MEWNQERMLQLIENYRIHPCLWDQKSKDYKNVAMKNDAFKYIADIMKCGPLEVKKKIESLMASFRRERSKTQLQRSGAGADETYTSKWFAYKSMEFLLDKYKIRNTQSTMGNETPNITEDSQDGTTVTCNDESEESTSTLENLTTPTHTNSTTKNSANKRKTDDPRVKAAFEVMSSLAKKSPAPRDPNDIFGEHVASKIKKYSERVQCIVHHKIANILFQADMGNFEQNPITASYREQFPILINVPETSPCSSSSTDDSRQNSSFSKNNPTPSTLTQLSEFINNFNSDTN